MILLNDFSRQWHDTQADAVGALVATGESGWYILGQEVRAFEESLAQTWGTAHAVGVASGLDAIEIALRALGCKTGSKVLTTPVSAFATTLAILKLGAAPVFVDTDNFGLIDLDMARAALSKDSSIRYMVPVHLYGHALDLDALAALKSEFDLAIVEDCAQSIGAHWDGVTVGTVGQMAATSFYPTKNLGALGDGGAVLTGDAELAAQSRMLRDYGQSAKYKHDAIGYNSRLDELQAALLRRVSLPRLAKWTERRRAVAAAYIAGIANPAVRVPGAPSKSASCWHLFPVTVPERSKAGFIAHLKQHGIAAGEHYPVAIPDQKAMQLAPFEIAGGGVEQARAFCRSEVSLPVHPYLSDDEVSAVIQAVNEWEG